MKSEVAHEPTVPAGREPKRSSVLRASLKSGLLSLGPGIITAALVFGPSKMTITSKLGAVYGYSLLWIVAVAIFFMTIFTVMGGTLLGDALGYGSRLNAKAVRFLIALVMLSTAGRPVVPEPPGRVVSRTDGGNRPRLPGVSGPDR